MDVDSCYVAAEYDTGEDRIMFVVKKCPADQNPCSHASWKKAACWSFTSEQAAMNMLRKHLFNSSYHAAGMTERQASLLVEMAQVDHVEETAQGCQTYRDEIDKMKKEKKEREQQEDDGSKPAVKPASKFMPKPHISGDSAKLFMEAVDERLRGIEETVNTVKRVSALQLHEAKRARTSEASSSSGSGNIKPPGLTSGELEAQRLQVAKTTKRVSLPIAKAQLLLDSLSRVKNSISQLQHLSVASAEKAKELAGAFSAAAEQWGREADVIASATQSLVVAFQSAEIT